MIWPSLVVVGIVGGLAAARMARGKRDEPDARGMPAEPSPSTPPSALHPYRSVVPASVASSARWGATPWKKRLVRLSQWLDALALHKRAARLQRKFERQEKRIRLNAIAHCWEQIQRDMHVARPPRCTCGTHEVEVELPAWYTFAETWNRGDPVQGRLVVRPKKDGGRS